MILHFEGTCDVCGGLISLDHDTDNGLLDIGVDDAGSVDAWVRHYATAPPGANPDCAIYSSQVWSAGDDPSGKDDA